jgi:hypothetical protein
MDVLLKWADWEGVTLRVIPYAKWRPERDPKGLREPGQFETMIELPYHILLSPSETQRWKISGFTTNKDNKYELWHMRATDVTRNDGPSFMRAVWSPELETSAELDNKLGDTFGLLARTAIGPNNCAAIVHNSSDLKL